MFNMMNSYKVNPIFHLKGAPYLEREVEAEKAKKKRSLCYLHQQAIQLQKSPKTGNRTLEIVLKKL